MASSRWPNAVTSACPVYISSMWPFRRPVNFHCLMNCGCARLAILRIATAEAGTVTSAIRASSQDTMNISVTTPTIVSSEVTSWLSVCCTDCCRLSMSLVTRLSISPRGCRSK